MSTPVQQRKCPQCEGTMIPGDKGPERVSPNVWSDVQQEFRCPDCGHTARLTLGSTIIFNCLTGLFGVALAVYAVLNMDGFLNYSRAGGMGIAFGITIGILFMVLIAGGGYAAFSAVRAIKHNSRYPNLTPASGLKTFLLTMAVSALPVLFSVGFGFYDFFVSDLDDYSLIVLPLVFSPIFIGAWRGMNFLGLFLGSAFWMGILVVIIFNFG